MKKWMSLWLATLLVLGLCSAALAEGEAGPVGVVDGNVYTNELFGFRMVLPNNWRFLSDTDLASFMGYDAAYANREGLAALLEQQGYVCGMYAAANDNPADNANFMIEDLQGNADLSEDDYYELTKDSLKQVISSQGYQNVQLNKKKVLVAGKEHTVMELTGTLGAFQVYMNTVIMKADKYIGAFSIATSSREATEAVIGFIEPLEDGFRPIEAVVPSLSSVEIPSVQMPAVGTAEAVSLDVWSVIGGICGTNWDKDFPMVEAAPGVWVSATLPLNAGDEYKFRVNGEWTTNHGKNGQDGANFVADIPGDCILTLDLNTDTVACVERTKDAWAVIGSICGTNWDVDFPMTEVEPGVWRSMPLAFKAKDEFKVRLNGNWDTMDYGEGCMPFGRNIVVPEDGVYTVTLDLNAQTLIYADAAGVQPEAKDAEADSWGVIGTIQGTNWDTDFPMHEVLPGVWTSDPLQMKAKDEFKVRLNGSWATNYGITDGALLQDGNNIVIEKDGLYMVTLNLNDLTLTW